MHKELIKNSLIMVSILEAIGIKNLPMTKEQGMEIEKKMNTLADMGLVLGDEKQIELFQEIFTDAMKEFLCYKLN